MKINTIYRGRARSLSAFVHPGEWTGEWTGDALARGHLTSNDRHSTTADRDAIDLGHVPPRGAIGVLERLEEDSKVVHSIVGHVGTHGQRHDGVEEGRGQRSFDRLERDLNGLLLAVAVEALHGQLCVTLLEPKCPGVGLVRQAGDHQESKASHDDGHETLHCFFYLLLALGIQVAKTKRQERGLLNR